MGKRIKWITLSILPYFVTVGFAQNGKVCESLDFVSAILNDTIKYSIYLPEGYEASDRLYPVVYILHGYTNNETTWIRRGMVPEMIEKGISEGEMARMILVMPDGGDTRFCNDYKNNKPWRDMFIKEFIPDVEKEYRIKPGKEFRAIAGQSMGGYGALMLAMKHPEVFSTCVALGAALYSDEDLANKPGEKYAKYWGAIYGEGLEGEERLTENWKAHNPLELVHFVPSEKLNAIRYYIDCGDDDLRTKGNSILHLGMLKAGISHEYRVRQGGHDWQYWRKGMYEGLKFITSGLPMVLR